MIKQYYILALVLIAFLIINATGERSNYTVSDTYLYNANTEQNDTSYKYGSGPVVLYYADIRSLKINDIEIRKRLYGDSINTINTLDQLNPLISMVVDFNREGAFNRFSLYQSRADDSWEEIISTSLTRSDRIYKSESIGYYPIFPEYLDSIKLTFIPTPSGKNGYSTYENSTAFLSELKIPPFIGKDCFLYNTSGNYYDGNKLLYKKIRTYESKYGYPKLKEISRETSLIKKQLKSSSEKIILYELDFLVRHYWEYLPISKKVIDSHSNDTLISQFYYYYENPQIIYDTYFTNEFDGEDTIKVQEMGDLTYLFDKDTIYNRHLWTGYSDYDYSGRTNIPPTGYGYITYFPNKLFEKEKFTKVSKENFFINGGSGYNYLLNALNNRELDYSEAYLIKEQYYDSTGNWHPASYKKQKEIEVLKKLPKRIIIQLTLTDFWFIELTD